MQYDLLAIISMNKFAFISDIHGNYPALRAVLKDIDSLNVDKIYCLGDLVGYYSQINEVINIIKSRGIECILGNHDYAIIHNKGVIDRSKTCTNVLTCQLGYISSDNLDFLRSMTTSLTIQAGDYKIFAVHGGLKDYVDEYLSDLSESYFDTLDKSITHVITAHNHLPRVERYGNVLYANSGSVGQPRDYNPMAGYVIFEDGMFTIRRVIYNIDETIQQMKIHGFPDYIADVLHKGCKIGG